MANRQPVQIATNVCWTNSPRCTRASTRTNTFCTRRCSLFMLACDIPYSNTVALVESAADNSSSHCFWLYPVSALVVYDAVHKCGSDRSEWHRRRDTWRISLNDPCLVAVWAVLVVSFSTWLSRIPVQSSCSTCSKISYMGISGRGPRCLSCHPAINVKGK